MTGSCWQSRSISRCRTVYRALLHLYKKNKAMYELDTDPAGFEWVNADDSFRSIYSFIRHSKDNKKNLLVVCNFTPMERSGLPGRRSEEKTDETGSQQ